MKTPESSAKLEINSPFVRAVKYIGIPLELGKYIVELSLNDRTYTRTFEVRKLSS